MVNIGLQMELKILNVKLALKGFGKEGVSTKICIGGQMVGKMFFSKVCPEGFRKGKGKK